MGRDAVTKIFPYTPLGSAHVTQSKFGALTPKFFGKNVLRWGGAPRGKTLGACPKLNTASARGPLPNKINHL